MRNSNLETEIRIASSSGRLQQPKILLHMRYQKLFIAGPNGCGTSLCLRNIIIAGKVAITFMEIHIALDFFSWLVLRTQNPSKSLKKPLLRQKDDNILPQER